MMLTGKMPMVISDLMIYARLKLKALPSDRENSWMNQIKVKPN